MLYRIPKTRVIHVVLASLLALLTGCGGSSNDSSKTESDISGAIPRVTASAAYSVLLDENITYAEGLALDDSSSAPFSTPLKLDIYYPDDSSTNRPVYMFIHGGGFTGGTKTKPEIVDMANYFASRGWVFVSIDYRTAEEIVTKTGMTQAELLLFYRGMAPQEWIEFALNGATTTKEFQQSIAMYMAQRDSKAALRWIMSNANVYGVNKDFITIGGASAGAITTIALGISNQEDFRDEMTVVEDSTLVTTNLSETYDVKSMVYFWGSNLKLELFDTIYSLYRYDGDDPELFMAHGTLDANPGTPFTEATELETIYHSFGIYNELVPLEGQGHGAWDATVNGKSLSEMTFDFIAERQGLTVE